MSNTLGALKQIKKKKYYGPYLNSGKEILCIGIAFDKEERNIKEYKIVTIDGIEKLE